MKAATPPLLISLLLAGVAPVATAGPSAATAETRHVTIDEARIAYRVIGHGPPLILANRMRGTLDTWDPLFLDSLAQSRTVYWFDYPGVGHSTGLLPTELSDVAALVGRLMAEWKVERAAVLGWSWGGYVAQAMVIDHPDRVTHALFVGNGPPGPNQALIQPAWLERALKPVNDLEDEEILFFEPRSPASREAARLSRERIHRARPDVVARIPSTMPEFQRYLTAHEIYRTDLKDRRGALTRSRTPILILCGDNDPSAPAENWYPLVGEIPLAQLIVLPQSGHGPQHQYPELSAAYIEAFLSAR